MTPNSPVNGMHGSTPSRVASKRSKVLGLPPLDGAEDGDRVSIFSLSLMAWRRRERCRQSEPAPASDRRRLNH